MRSKERLKVARPVGLNKGLQADGARRIAAFIRKSVRAYIRQSMRDLRAMHMAQDAANADDIIDSVIETEGAAAVSSVMRQTFSRRQQRALEDYLASLHKPAERVSRWFLKRMVRQLSRDQLKQLLNAGVSRGVIKSNWTVPVIRGHYIAPSAAAKLPDYANRITHLISGTVRRQCYRLQDTMADGLANGMSYRDLEDTLENACQIDTARAQRVAVDQLNKIDSFIKRENLMSVGITQGIWIHLPGTWESRETHKEMNGKIFDLNKGLFDDDRYVQKYVLPGSEPFCRCTFRPVIPKEIQA